MSSGRILAVLIAALVAVNAKPNLGVCSKSTPVQVGRNDVSSFTNLADTDTLSGNSIYHPAWLSFYAPYDGAYDFEVTNWSINNATRMALYSARFPRNCKTPKLEAYNDDIGSKWHGPFARDNLDVIQVEDDEAAPADYAAEGQEEDEDVAAISIGDDLEVNNEFGFGYNRRSRFVVPLVKGHYKIALGNENDGVLGGNGELKISVKLGWCNSQINVANKGNNDVDTKISQGYSENGIHKSVWFTFKAPQDDVYNIETTSWSSRGDSQLAIYDNECNKNQYSANNSAIDSNDDYRGSDLSFIRHFMYEGDTILIQVGNAHSWQRHATGNLKISRSPGWCESTTNQWTTVHTGSNSVSAHWSEADDITYEGIKIDEPVWLTFTVEDAGAYKFEVNDWDVDDDDNDSAMAIFSSPSGVWPDACPLAKDNNLHLIEIHDDIRVSQFVPALRNYRSRIVLELEEGEYKIALGNGVKSGSGSWRKGAGTLNIKLLPGWCNDQIHHLNAEGITAIDASDSWHTLHSQSDIYEGVWFEFEAPKTATFIFETLAWSNGDSEIALFNGECPDPSEIAINDDIRARDVVSDEVAEANELVQISGEVANQKGERALIDIILNALNIKNKLSRTELAMTQGDKVKIYVGNADDDDSFATGSLEIHEAIGRCATALDGSIDTNIAIDASRADSPVVNVGGDKIYNGVWIKFTAYDTAYYEFEVTKWNQPVWGQAKLGYSRAALFKTSCTGELIKKDTSLGKSNIKATIEAGETVYFVVGNPFSVFDQETDGTVRITRHWGECDDNSIRPAETWDNEVNGTIASAADISSGSTKVYEPIWFKFKVPESGTWVFEVTDWESDNDKRQIVQGNSKNAAIAVRGSSCFSGSWKGFNDNQNTLNVRPRLALKATKDETLRIAVGNGVNGRLAGSGNLRIYLAGGTCEDPYNAKEGFPYNDIYSTNTSGIVVNGVNNPIWYVFQAPRYGTYTLEVTSWDNGITDNSQIVAYKFKASCSNLQKLAENNDIFFPFNLRSKAEVTLDKNEKIFIVVGNDLAFPLRGNGTLAITHRPGRCNTRYYIEAGKFYNVNATVTEAPEKKIGTFDFIWKPVYYRFRAQESAVHVIDVASWDNDGDNDAEVAIWSMDDDDGCDLPTHRIVATDDDYADTKLPLISAYLQKNKRYTIALGNAKPLQKAGVGKFALSAHGHCRNADRLRFWRTNNVIAWDAAAEDYDLGNDYNNITIYTPVWTKFKSGRTGRYHFAVTYWDDGPNDGDDSIMAAVKGYCRDPTFLTANDNSDHFTPDSKKSRVELSMDANDEIKIVVGSRNPTTRGWGKIKITFRDEPAKFAMVVPEDLTNAQIEAAINRALESPQETDDTVNFISKPDEPTKKRSVLDKYYFDGAEPGFKIVYFEAAEGSDSKMATLTKILVNRNGTYSLIGSNFSPMLCVADCDGHDFDGDTVDDGVDVCPGVPDPLQRNSDGQGLGDLCQCAFVNAIIDPESLKDQGGEYYGHIQTCDLLNEDNTKYHYHGQDKKAGDWVRNYVRKIGAVTFQPGDYTHTDKWLDCWCNTWDIDAGTPPPPPLGPSFGPQVAAEAEPFEWDSEIVDSDFQRPLEPPAVSAVPESEN